MVVTQFHRNVDYKTTCYELNEPAQRASALQDNYEMIFLEKGTAEYWIEDQYYKAHEGDVLIIPAGVMLGGIVKAKACPVKFYHLEISPRFLQFLKLQDDDVDINFMRTVNNKRYLFRLSSDNFILLKQTFEALMQENDDEKLNAEFSFGAMISILLVRVNRLLGEADEEALLLGDENRLSDVIKYIHENCTEAISVEDLANKFAFSSSHLAHSFKKQLGTSLYHYVLLRRLKIGREAMLQNVPVKEAYLRCGFGDYAGFYRAFIKEFGLSPQQYKQKSTKGLFYQ